MRWYGVGWRGSGVGGQGGVGLGVSAQPGATRPARTGHRRVGGGVPSLGFQLLLELLDLPRGVVGSAARVRFRVRRGKGTPTARRHRGWWAATVQATHAHGVACRVCVQLRAGARHVLVSRADERVTGVANVGAVEEAERVGPLAGE